MTAQAFKIYALVVAAALLSWGLVSYYEQQEQALVETSADSVDYFSQGYRKKEMDV